MRVPLLLLLLALGSALRSPQPPEARAKLCGHHLVRALVRVCGGPHWSPEATQPVETRDRGAAAVAGATPSPARACGRRGPSA
ncbi:Insulin-like 3 [Apodemus speciosus]|uniref:Insulin-like 3 n=1 Tax=Apodemus speciosus TaxID=105296 RepID=A0ABQ0F1X4_APOSI